MMTTTAIADIAKNAKRVIGVHPPEISSEDYNANVVSQLLFYA
jgi:hypothetical protein